MDCIHYKIRDEGRILSWAAYVVLGVTAEGYKKILNITVGTNETSKFWLGMLNDLTNYGMQDGLLGLQKQYSYFPRALFQLIHLRQEFLLNYIFDFQRLLDYDKISLFVYLAY